MTFTAEGPVASGQMYFVTLVNGQRPHRLDDFAGDVEVTLIRDSQSLSLVGEGAVVDGAVQLCQKERGSIDRDVRVWTVSEHGDGHFVAEPTAAF